MKMGLIIFLLKIFNIVFIKNIQNYRVLNINFFFYEVSSIPRVFLLKIFKTTVFFSIFNSGINFSFLFLNNTFGIDPRISLKYKYNPRNKFTFSIGLHSRPEHLSTYFVELVNPNGTLSSPNLNLKMQRAFHIIAGYDFQVTEKVKLKAELYYQYLFNIPVSENASNGFSVLNTDDVFDIIFNNDRSRSRLLSDGKGNNYGIDLTLERPFSDGYYFLFTASLFDSKYTMTHRNIL